MIKHSGGTMHHRTVIHAIPFVPGQAPGLICLGPAGAAAESLVVLHWWEIKQLKTRPAGVIVVGYAPLAHPMIRLLGLGVPVVVVSEQQASSLRAGQALIIDGNYGVISAMGQQEVAADNPPPLEPNVSLQTVDGTSVVLRTSVDSLASAQRSQQFGASGIGLVRSERFNPDDGSLPDASFYRQTLGDLCATVAPLPVTVRLIDIAQDKRPAWLGDIPGMQGPLGLKGARLYDSEPVRSVVYAELDALNELALRYAVSVMLPYIVQPEEFLYWREVIVKRLSVVVPIGTMIETPVAALALSEFMQLADFVAIGCNDLMQCLFAADRDIVEVGNLLDPYSPFLFRFMRQVAESVNENEMTRIQLCGLLSQTPGVMPIMLGLGYRYFSVEPYLLPYLARCIRETNLAEARLLARDVCYAHNAGMVRDRLGMPRDSVWSMGQQVQVAGDPKPESDHNSV